MDSFTQVKELLIRVLQLGERGARLDSNSPLLAALPELDSIAVVNLLAALEAQFDVCIEDDEIDAGIFETLGTLVSFVDNKLVQ